MTKVNSVVKLEEAREKLRKRYPRADSWENPFTGLGTTRDKVTYGIFTAGPRVSDEELDVLYAENDVAARICEGMPELALRKGIEISVAPDKDFDGDNAEDAVIAAQETASDISDKLNEIKTIKSVLDAAVWGNVFGAGAIILGGADGAEGDELLEPLNEDKIDDIAHLNVIDKRYLTPIKWYDDPMAKNFGKPMTYLVTPQVYTGINTDDLIGTGGIYEIHESRLLLFGGVRTSIKRRQDNDGWEDGLIQRCYKVLSQFGQSFDSLAHMIQDANQAMFKMDGLIDALAADEQNVISARMQMIDMSRSLVRAVVLDAEREEFSRQNFSWQGIEKPFELMMQRLSMAAKQPVSAIMGRAPQGMNATGEHDTKNLYDQVEAYRDQGELRENLERLIHLVLVSKNGPTGGQEPEKWELKFPSLYSMTPKESAEIYETQARGDTAYVTTGVLLPDEVAISRFGPGDSEDIEIDMEARTGFEDGDMGDPDPTPDDSSELE